MMPMQLVASALVFVSIALLTGVILLSVFSEERSVARALRRVSDWESQQAQAAEPLLQPFAQRVVGPVGTKISSAVSSAMPANARAAVQHKIDLAGNPNGLTPDGVVAWRIGGGVGGAVLGLLIVLVFHTGFSIVSLIVFGALFALGLFGIDLYLSQTGQRRQQAIQRSLPDMLDMLTISVQAGLGFDMALAKLVRTTDGPLSYEFARMLNEVQAGVARRDALRHLADRTNVPEVNNFVVAMVQADIFGVSISGILREQSNELRTRRRQRAEEQAQKAPVKIVFPVIVCILPATLMVILGPAIVSIGRAFGLIQ